MKKLFSIFIVLIFVSSVLFAAVDSKDLKVNLDLSAVPIEYFGISDTALSDTITHAGARALFSDDLESIAITPTANDPTQTSKATFHLWWYIYSPNQFKMYISFSDLTSGTNKIPYKITSDSKVFNSTGNYDEVIDLNSSVLIKGSTEMTVPAFDRFTLTVADNYVSTVTIKIDTN